MQNNDEKYIEKCLKLAIKGKGYVEPNPLVGCIIIKNGKIIGKGYHKKFGESHAEVNAINDALKRTKSLKGSTLYVNLEPCAHFGKTPPCSLAIKDAGFPRIVIGCKDPNPEVSGKGIFILDAGGAEVITGVLNEDCRLLNRRFFTFHEQKRPYVILKWAETNDGFIDEIRKVRKKVKPVWITNHTSKMLVHKWRSEEISIMAGTNTILLDNPELTVRDWTGVNPLRVVPDRYGRLFDGLHIMSQSAPGIIFTGDSRKAASDSRYILIPMQNFEIPKLLQELYKRQIISVFVEGGSKFIQSFMRSGLWDEARVFKGPQTFTNGVKAPLHVLSAIEKLSVRGIELSIYRRSKT